MYRAQRRSVPLGSSRIPFTAIGLIQGLVGDLGGVVLDLEYEPVAGADVFSHRPNETDFLARRTGWT
ncbi:MAG: hypothetical protein FJ297_03645 [Planctomycetes bacterium]|nr:hypothetical protein [Planctomycetota bacterium]